MQTLHRLWRFRDLRAVSPRAWPPADGVPVRCVASEWKGALPLPNLPKPTYAVGSRRAALVRQAMAHPGDGPAHRWQHDRQPVGVAACLPVCAVACLPVCMSACLHVWQSARLCPPPDR